MKYNLFINFYRDKNPKRQEELEYCLFKNLLSFDTVNVVAHPDDCSYFERITNNIKGKAALRVIIDQVERPTYSYFFQIINQLYPSSGNINVISNTDIFIPKDTLKKSDIFFNQNLNICLALSRWELGPNLSEDTAQLLDRWDSQDTWLFNGAVSNIEHSDFNLGTRGCDNAIAERIERAGYDVINPSKTLKTYHLHLTNIRNYNDDLVPQPYKFLNPTV